MKNVNVVVEYCSFSKSKISKFEEDLISDKTKEALLTKKSVMDQDEYRTFVKEMSMLGKTKGMVAIANGVTGTSTERNIFDKNYLHCVGF